MDERRSDEPGRRGEDKRWLNVQAQLTTTRQAISSLEQSVEDLKDEIKILDTSIYGGARYKDSISERLKIVESQTLELFRVVIGDAGGNHGLKKMVEGMAYKLGSFTEALQGITESKKERVTRYSAIVVAGITTLGLVFTSLDKIALGTEQFVRLFRQEPLSYETIKRDIDKLRKTRGPEIEKMLRELERERRRRR